jgi:hypothetical protein
MSRYTLNKISRPPLCKYIVGYQLDTVQSEISSEALSNLVQAFDVPSLLASLGAPYPIGRGEISYRCMLSLCQRDH